MKVTFLGVGEVADNILPNNSQLIETKSVNVLFDCGYSVPQQWFKLNKNADFLDAIWISHQHFDHFGGLPVILLRMWQEGRTIPLTVFCESERVDFFRNFLDMAFPGFLSKCSFALNFIGVTSKDSLNFKDNVNLSFAPMQHSISALAIRFQDGEKSYCYSGDGHFTDEAVGLYHNSDLLVHETYLYNERRIEHACITNVVLMAEKQGVKHLALTHMQRDFRNKKLPNLRHKIKSNKVEILIPEPMDSIEL